MITAARPRNDHERPHYYYPDGRPCYAVPCKSRPGETRAVTVADCRKLRLVPSPTTICRLLHREMLVQWKCEQTALAVLTTPRRDGEDLDAYVQRVLHVERVHEQERNVAAEKGRAIHAALAEVLSGARSLADGDELTPFILPVLDPLGSFGRCVATEKTIVGDGYCGITDCVLVNEEEIWVIDFKCTRTIPAKPYDEHRLQLAAYAAGLGNTGNQRVRCANCYISSVDPGRITFSEIDPWPDDYARFRLLLDFWKRTNKVL